MVTCARPGQKGIAQVNECIIANALTEAQDQAHKSAKDQELPFLTRKRWQMRRAGRPPKRIREGSNLPEIPPKIVILKVRTYRKAAPARAAFSVPRGRQFTPRSKGDN